MKGGRFEVGDVVICHAHNGYNHTSNNHKAVVVAARRGSPGMEVRMLEGPMTGRTWTVTNSTKLFSLYNSNTTKFLFSAVPPEYKEQVTSYLKEMGYA